MTETEESRAAAIAEWRNLISSPKSLFPSLISEGFSPMRSPRLLNGSDLSFPASAVADSEGEIGARANLEKTDDDDGFFGGWKPAEVRNGGSIAERRAARCGFNAPTINTARFRCISPMSSPLVRSPYLTIPAGLSPTALLDSPVMLSNSRAQSSPTTGTFPLPSMSQESRIPISTSDIEKSENVDCSFVFKPHVNPISIPCLSSIEKQVTYSSQAQLLAVTDVSQHSLSQMQQEVNFDPQVGLSEHSRPNSYNNDSQSEIEGSSNMVAKMNYAIQTCSTGVDSDQAPQLEDTPNGEEEDQKGRYPSMGMGRPPEDVYNWRKYGQKQVKGSEYPRSYYKCTHPTCQVKKKVERSHDGQITEIIYKGGHNHPKPQPSRRLAIGSGRPLNDVSEMSEANGSNVKAEGGSVWRSIQQGSREKGNADWRTDGFERSSSTSVVTELSDPASTAQGKQLSVIESVDTPELSTTLASQDDEDDRATQGSISLGEDAYDYETESKRRKKESFSIETNLASRAIREPRVVVQTASEVDILDDGYRWRKYGQKVVKGNPNPRSYYKCTHAGCTVRKHVERASHDLKSVITTYEGKHNHEVPAARNSSHMNSVNGNSSAPNVQTTVTLSVPATIQKPEPQVHDLAPRFERKPDVNDYLKLGFIGRFPGDIKIGASPCYDMTMPPMQPLSFDSFGQNGVNQAATFSPVNMEFPLGFSTGLHRPANLALSGIDFNDGRFIRAAENPLFGQQLKEGDMRYVKPKEEQNDDAVYEPQLPVNQFVNPPPFAPVNHLSNSSFPHIYGQIMGVFPL